jgi:hypothetical protein
VSDPPGLTPSLDGEPAQKFNPHHDEIGRFTFAPDGAVYGSERPQPAARRRTGPRGTPAQEARHDAAAARAREAVRRLRELEPAWQGPQSVSESIEGRIAHQEATARAAEGRLAEILRGAIPNTNPSWGVNRLVKELHDQGYVLIQPSRRGSGLVYENPSTGEQVRIMERPPTQYRGSPPEKYTFEHYYRYRPGRGKGEGAHVPIPNKD